MPFRITPRRLCDFLATYGFRNFTRDECFDFAESNRFLRRGADRAHRSHFIDYSIGKHRFDSLPDSFIEFVAVAEKNNAASVAFLVSAAQLRSRAAGEQTNLQRADQSPLVVTINGLRTSGVEHLQPNE